MTNSEVRKTRARARIRRFSKRTKLTVFRSGKHIYAQIIEPKTGKILASASDLKIENKEKSLVKAEQVGQDIAQKALKLGVKEVVFDRGSYKYHGRVKALCEGARKAKLVI